MVKGKDLQVALRLYSWYASEPVSMCPKFSRIPIKYVVANKLISGCFFERRDRPASASQRFDEMGSRINELEQSINELRSEMAMEGSPSPSVPTREKTPLSELNLKEENN